jgi:hypothetical protein
MANLKTDGYQRLWQSVGELGRGAEAIGKKIKDTITGSGRGGARAGKGVLGVGNTVANSGAKITGNVMGGIGNFAKDHPGVASVIALAIAYKPIKHFVDKLRGKKEARAVGTQNEILALQQTNNQLRMAMVSPEQLDAMARAQASRQLGQRNVEPLAADINPNNRNFAGKIHAERNGGIGVLPTFRNN